MKSTGTIETGTGLWYDPNTGATNESGFTGLPGGYRSSSGDPFNGIGNYGSFWSSTEGIPPDAKGRRLRYNNDDVYTPNVWKSNGYSIRCLKDD